MYSIRAKSGAITFEVKAVQFLVTTIASPAHVKRCLQNAASCTGAVRLLVYFAEGQDRI